MLVKSSSTLIMFFIFSAFSKNKINIFMNNFRRSHRSKGESSSFAVQSDPKDFSQLESELNSEGINIKSVTSKTFNQPPSVLQKGNQNNNTSIQDPEKSDARQSQKSKFKPFRARKNQQSKVMKLQNDSINFDTNVYNLSINDLSQRESYLSTLNYEVQTLRNRISELEHSQNSKIFRKTINYQEEYLSSYGLHNYNEDRSRSIEVRRSMCGKFYSRGLMGLNSDRRSSQYSIKDGQSIKPQEKQRRISDFDSFAKDRSSSEQQKRGNKHASRPISSYKMKQNSKRYAENSTKSGDQVVKFRPANSSANLRKQLAQTKQQIIKETPQELKTVFVSKPEWQIKSIDDDFRDKIIKKLQIPQAFPIKVPQMSDTIQQNYKISQEIYAIFGVDIQKCKQKLVVRRFKNGIYFQLKPDKNIVWYFHGTFYFGEWQTDLPSEGDKNGFGFQYVPKKYFYLGNFKDGMRHGKGTIKIINIDEPRPDCFACYAGEWAKGKPHGYGFQIDQKDNKYMGYFKNGDKTGNAILLNKDGLFYEGQVKNGLKNGYGVQKLVNGDAYMGQFVEGKFQGHGIYKWKNGSIYQGQFQRGKRQGPGKWKSYNGDEFDGEYANDIKNGWGKFTWANGQIYEGEFRNDIRHGPGTYKHPSGKMGKFMWIDGQIDHRLYTKQEQEYRCRNMKKDIN